MEYTLPATNELFRWACESCLFTLIVDENGIIRHIGERHAQLYNGKASDFIGRPVQEVIPNTGVLRILSTGEGEFGDIFVTNPGSDHEQTFIVSRIPVRDEYGQVRGVFTMALFNTLDVVTKLQNQISELSKVNELYRKQLKRLSHSDSIPDYITGKSPSIVQLKETLARVAPADLPVLLTGETGVGKEVFANAIHQMSYRKDYDFIKINCAAIPKDLIESELFGYEPGAFSGALRTGKQGKFEQANHGTILLDEVGELPLAMQSKLLRVLQEYEFERIGGSKVIHLDARIVAATNQNLKQLVREGKFRSDLYYRLNVVELEIPPLRERMSDLEPLCATLLRKIERRYKLPAHFLSPGALSLLRSHSWPGNIRELEHCLSRACVMCTSSLLTETDFHFLKIEGAPSDSSIGQEPAVVPTAPPLPESLQIAKQRAEREEILHALKCTGGNKVKAAKLLGISRSRLYVKLNQYGIDLRPESI